MDSQDIRYEVRDRVATLALHRPEKLNAFTRRMRDEPIDAFGRGGATFDDTGCDFAMAAFYPWWEDRPFK